jgi:hypothetical protein
MVRAISGLIEYGYRALYHQNRLRVINVVSLPAYGVLTEEKGTDDMAKFNIRTARATGSSPLTAEPQPTGKTHEGGTGYQRDAQSELFLRATCNFAGEDTFYEQAATADERLRELVHGLATTDDGWAWVKEFVPWLRAGGNIRTASITLAAEAVKARLDKGLSGDGNRQLIPAVMLRADEPGEMIAYWLTRYGRNIPMPVKRGVADGVQRLYTERNFLRYDKTGNAIRFGDVLDLVHPRATSEAQGMLYSWAITARHSREAEPPEALKAVSARRQLSKMPLDDRHEFAHRVVTGDEEAFTLFQLALAGQWEWAKSWLGG